MDPKIIKFIKEHHVITLATSKKNIPWTAHCFYAFLEKENALVFTTDDDTRHASEMMVNSIVAGGISLETKVVGKIRGAQITGKVQKLEKGNEQSNARKVYLYRFPYAALVKTSLWVLVLETVKFTDNRMGFGKKILWERNPTVNTDQL